MTKGVKDMKMQVGQKRVQQGLDYKTLSKWKQHDILLKNEMQRDGG